MTEKKVSTFAAAQASRANGSLSKGPRSAAGKRASARNSQKHGLFSIGLGHNEAMSPSISSLASELQAHANRDWEAQTLREVALDAATRLELAMSLVSRTRDDVASLLYNNEVDMELLSQLLEELIRYGRYERRLRGRRDRAVRRLIGLPAADRC